MTPALVAASHGTRVPEARRAITALVEAVRTSAPWLDVLETFVDVEEPRVGPTVERLHGPAVVVPLLLAPGFHVNVDIAAAVRRPGTIAARTLGPDPRLTEILLERLAAEDATTDDVVVLAASGSTDARALRSVDAAARLLGAAWGAPIPVGHVGGSGNPIDAVVREVARSGRRVVVASYVMAPGYFHDRLTRCGADVVARPLLDGTGVPPGMVDLVLDRHAASAELLDKASTVGERWM